MSHGDPIAPVLVYLAIILIAAKVGGHIAVRLGQAAVLGELLFGVWIGNLGFMFDPLLEPIEHMLHDPTLDMLSRLGVILLLFEVGLESTVSQMAKVGWASFFVATLGVVAPFGLGYGVGVWLLPHASFYAHLFLGATLTATSVGITARVLKDLNQAQSTEARIILGAAVIDDVMGLIILAVVTAMIGGANSNSNFDLAMIFKPLGLSVGFLAGAIVIGMWLSPRMFKVAFRLRSTGVLLAVSLGFCFVLSYLANAFGLATIVGAFAAGLVLERLHFSQFQEKGEHELEELIHPLTSVFVPVFFILMGMKTDMRVFANTGVLFLAGTLTLVALLGKLLCGWGARSKDTKLNKLAIGIGMIPRGEVGLIFASIGMTLKINGVPIMDQGEFSAIVAMVILTTLITPPLLSWVFKEASFNKRVA